MLKNSVDKRKRLSDGHAIWWCERHGLFVWHAAWSYGKKFPRNWFCSKYLVTVPRWKLGNLSKDIQASNMYYKLKFCVSYSHSQQMPFWTHSEQLSLSLRHDGFQQANVIWKIQVVQNLGWISTTLLPLHLKFLCLVLKYKHYRHIMLQKLDHYDRIKKCVDGAMLFYSNFYVTFNFGRGQLQPHFTLTLSL